MPTPVAAVAPPQADGLLNWVGPLSAERLLSGTVYTDGQTYDPRLLPLSRSGCGFAQVDDQGVLSKGAWWPLAAPVQTPPEAELVVATEAARNANANMDIIFDCLAIEKGLTAGKDACARSGAKFQGRWRELWMLLDDVSWAFWKEGDRPDVQVAFR